MVNDQKSNADDRFDEVAHRLRREAMEERPQFSQELHRRIMSQVCTSKLSKSRCGLDQGGGLIGTGAGGVCDDGDLDYAATFGSDADGGVGSGDEFAAGGVGWGEAWRLAINFSGLLSANFSPSGVTVGDCRRLSRAQGAGVGFIIRVGPIAIGGGSRKVAAGVFDRRRMGLSQPQ